jgi:uncharacterized protein (TIGR02996 family)
VVVSSTESQLLAAVLANPRDDAPRLVYADWLIERRDPRGEFIARQVRDPDGPEGITVEQSWEWFRFPKIGHTFRRGFAEQIWLGKLEALDRLSEILAAHPVDHIGFTDVSRAAGVRKLVASPHLGAIRKLTFMTGYLTGAMIESLQRAKKLALEELRIDDDFELDGARLIGRWPGLKRLVINRYYLKVSHALAIVRGSALATVRSLALGTMFEKLRDVSAMVEGLVSNKKATLEELTIDWSKLEGTTLRKLLERFAGLRQLSLRHAWISDAKAKLLAARPELASLKRLDLADNEIGDPGAKMLAGTKFLDQIERLDLAKNKIGPVGQAALRKRFGDRVLL